MSLYDPERDRVRIAGRWLRWSLLWAVLPAAVGVFIGGNVDVRSLPLVGAERLSAVLFQDGQAYFGHLDDSGESGTLVLRDVYYFRDSQNGPSGLPVGLVRRGTEAHEPADGMRINRDRVLAIERVGPLSSVANAIGVDRQVRGVNATLSLNPRGPATPSAVAAQRVAAEHMLQRGWMSAAEQLAKINELVLPVTKAEARTITEKTLADLRAVRRNALAAIANALRMPAAEVETYVRNTDAAIDAQSYASDAPVLLAPDLDAVVTGATRLYAQVGDAAAKQLTQPRTASPSPTPTPSPRP